MEEEEAADALVGTYDVVKRLGRGSYGTVYLVQASEDGAAAFGHSTRFVCKRCAADDGLSKYETMKLRLTKYRRECAACAHAFEVLDFLRSQPLRSIIGFAVESRRAEESRRAGSAAVWRGRGASSCRHHRARPPRRRRTESPPERLCRPFWFMCDGRNENS